MKPITMAVVARFTPWAREALWALLLVSGLLGLGIPVEGAHVGRQLDLETLTETATVIVRARCLRQETRLENGRISTHVRLQALEAVKGAPLPELEVRVPGGVVPVPGRSDGLGLEAFVPDAPRFRENAESVLFLWSGAPTPSARLAGVQYLVVGFRQGKIDVASDGTVAAPHPRRGMLRPGGIPESADASGPTGERVNRGDRIPVAELIARIRAHSTRGTER